MFDVFSGASRLAPAFNNPYALAEAAVSIAVAYNVTKSYGNSGKAYIRAVITPLLITVMECALLCLRHSSTKHFGFGNLLLMRAACLIFANCISLDDDAFTAAALQSSCAVVMMRVARLYFDQKAGVFLV